MLEYFANVADVATQASVAFHIVLWVVILVASMFYYYGDNK